MVNYLSKGIFSSMSRGPGAHGVDYSLVASALGITPMEAVIKASKDGHGLYAMLTEQYSRTPRFYREPDPITRFDIDMYMDLFGVKGIKSPGRYTFHTNRNPDNYLEPLAVNLAILHLFYDGFGDGQSLELLDNTDNSLSRYSSFAEYVHQLEETGSLAAIESTAYYDLADKKHLGSFISKLHSQIKNHNNS